MLTKASFLYECMHVLFQPLLKPLLLFYVIVCILPVISCLYACDAGTLDVVMIDCHTDILFLCEVSICGMCLCWCRVG